MTPDEDRGEPRRGRLAGVLMASRRRLPRRPWRSAWQRSSWPPSRWASAAGAPSHGPAERRVAARRRPAARRGPGLYSIPSPPDLDYKYGTDELVSALVKAAAYVDREAPGARLHVGDLSVATGGPTSRHESHQNGRDPTSPSSCWTRQPGGQVARGAVRRRRAGGGRAGRGLAPLRHAPQLARPAGADRGPRRGPQRCSSRSRSEPCCCATPGLGVSPRGSWSAPATSCATPGAPTTTLPRPGLLHAETTVSGAETNPMYPGAAPSWPRGDPRPRDPRGPEPHPRAGPAVGSSIDDRPPLVSLKALDRRHR